MDSHCDRARQSIEWFMDDELDAEGTLELETHLNECDGCRGYFERRHELREALRGIRDQVACPQRLRREVGGFLDAERRRSRWSGRWPAVAAAAMLLALVARGGFGGEDFEAVAERHARNLPMDVVAADFSQVQQYFRDKLPFRVSLPRFEAKPTSNCGGRLVHVQDRDAAYVRCDMPHGRLSVFVYEGSSSGLSEVAPLYRVGRSRILIKQVRGYTVAKWRASGLTYSLVADLPPQEVFRVLEQSMR